MQLRVTSLPGDGIGPEVISQAICVLEEVATGFGHDLELDEKEIGGVALAKFGNPLPDSTVQACLASQAVVLGAVGRPAFAPHPGGLRPEGGHPRRRRRRRAVDKSCVAEGCRGWVDLLVVVAGGFPDLQDSHMPVDAAAMSLV